MSRPLPSEWLRPAVLEQWPEGAAPPLYPYLHGGRWEADRRRAASPDPLCGYVWEDRLTAAPLEPLQCYALLPVKAELLGGEAEGLETLHAPGSCLRVKRGLSLRLDLGVESAAWLEFESEDLRGDVRCAISEYNQPGVVNRGAEHPEKAARPERIGNTWRLKLNALHYEGLRFGWLHLTGLEQPCTLRNLRAVCQIKPTNYRGAFQSSEPLLNRIWETGAYAVKLNLHQDYIGSILMERSDRHSWTGDAYATQAASLAAFGNLDFIRENTRRMEDDDNGIESYALYWILALTDYLRWSGDTDFWQTQLERIAAKLEHAAAVFDDPEFFGYRAFCGHDDRLGGFAEDTPDGNRWLYAGLAARTVVAVLEMLAALPPTDGGGRLRKAAGALRARCAGVLEGGLAGLGLHDGSEVLMAGLGSDSARMELARRIYANPVRTVSYSPFNGYFVLEGMARSTSWAAAGALLDRCWGGMLRLGASTFWESFRPEWLEVMEPNDPIFCGTQGYTSLCHPWSGGPTRWLSDHVLGLSATAPGWKRMRMAPATGLVAQVTGVVPTPLGTVEVERDGGEARVCLPGGMQGTGPQGEPLNPGWNELRASGRPVPVALDGFGCVHDWAWLPDGDPQEEPGTEWAWRAFGAAEDGGDLSAGLEGLPFELTVDIEGEVYVPPGTLPGGASGRSSLSRRQSWPHREAAPKLLRGALRGRSPRPCQQTVRLRVTGDLSAVAEVALWFADPLEEGLICSVDVLAEPERHMVLPTRKVEKFREGRVLRFCPEHGFLLRVCNRIDRPDTSLSAIAFKFR